MSYIWDFDTLIQLFLADIFVRLMDQEAQFGNMYERAILALVAVCMPRTVSIRWFIENPQIIPTLITI